MVDSVQRGWFCGKMESILIAIVVIVILAVIAFALKFSQLLKGEEQSLYEAKGNLLTPAELKFFGILDQVIGSHYRLMAQVRLADILKVKSGLDSSTRSSAFNRIKAKHLDFVACDPNDMSVKFAIELDDSSHRQAKRKKRDAFLEKAMKGAGVPLYRFAVKREYNPQEVYNTLFGQPPNP
jgi:hypothetical protein